jgi:chromosome segregation ATPase
MARQETSTDVLRERLTSLLADWGAEMSMLLRELDETRKKLAEQSAGYENYGKNLKTLEDRVSGQSELIETLRAEAATAGELRGEVRAKDLENERLASEVESKQDLIRVLRRDAEGVERLKAEAKAKDQASDALQKERRKAEKQVEDLRAELESLRESADDDNSEGAAELQAVRAELEARKALIKSLRADADRVATLETRLEEKREIVANLEASINKHVETIAELKRTSEQWKKKYQALRGRNTPATTELPELSETDVAALQQLDTTDVAKPEHTIAIDMRRPLSEARRKAAQNHGKS